MKDHHKAGKRPHGTAKVQEQRAGKSGTNRTGGQPAGERARTVNRSQGRKSRVPAPMKSHSSGKRAR